MSDPSLRRRATLPPDAPNRRVSTRPIAVPLARRGGRVAAEASARARIEEARASGTVDAEAAACAELARLLGSHDRDLDAAITAALRALSLGEDRELSQLLVGWLECLGEYGLAAAELRKLVANEDRARGAQFLLKVGVLYARAGDAASARAAFEEASALDPQDALASELLGTLAVWARDEVSAAVGAAAYVDAAERRARAGAADAELEDLLRAFETDPASPHAARALSAALERDGKPAAADDVWREHAAAARAAGALVASAAIHERRRAEALASGDLARALVAALDANEDSVLDSPSFDDLLSRVGLTEAIAARFVLRALASGDPAAGAEALRQRAQLLRGPLANVERALRALARAVWLDPTAEGVSEICAALPDAPAATDAVVRALVRAASSAPERATRSLAGRSLAEIAEAAGEPALARWAWERVLVASPTDGEAAAKRARADAEARRLDEALSPLEDEAGRDPATLARLLQVLSQYPDRDIRRAEIAERAGLRGAAARHAIDAALRAGDAPRAERAARAAAAAEPSGEWVGVVVDLRLDQGDLAGAARAVAALPPELVSEELAAIEWLAAALENMPLERGHGLLSMAARAQGSLRSALGALAAELLTAAGDRRTAVRAAELACHADPHSPRAVAALAGAFGADGGRTAASALERAMTIGYPRGVFCARLADALERLGELTHAVGWTQRLVALRPGDVAGVTDLVRRVLAARDSARVADTLSWALSQPQPTRPLADLMVDSIPRLAELDVDRAVVFARRALDVLGPRHANLRAAIESVARAAGDERLAALVLERWVAAGAPASERAPAFMEIAARQRALGDSDEEARALARASREGAAPAEVASRLAALGPLASLSPDGELFALEARARATTGPSEDVSHAFRELGAALWDVAGDRAGAIRAWMTAASAAPGRGWAVFASDLAWSGGREYALECLVGLVEHDPEPRRRGALAGEAAKLALAAGDVGRALALAERALEEDSDRADSIAVAERACAELGRLGDLSNLYDRLAARARGRFGRRAAHFRGARFFEKRGEGPLALKHAASAFAAVPSEGQTLTLLDRTSARAQERAVAVRTVEQVAELSRSPAMRAHWLLRAATLAGDDEEGARQRVDLLLRAVVVSPAPATAGMLADAIARLVEKVPDERDVAVMRLSRAQSAMGARLEGPDGARVALAFARSFATHLADPYEAWRAVTRALNIDGDLDEEYAAFEDLAATLGAACQHEELSAVIAEVEKPLASVGPGALRLLLSIARSSKDRDCEGRLTVLLAEKDSDDDAALSRGAEVAAVRPELRERFQKKVRPERLLAALEAERTRLLEAGEPEEAVRVAERASALGPASERARLDQIVDLTRAQSGVSLARRTLSGARLPLDAARAALVVDPTSEEAWDRLEERLVEAGDGVDREAVLRELVLTLPPAGRGLAARRLARQIERQGDAAAAEAAWREALVLAPGDEEATLAVESLLAARQAYEELAEHLGQRAARMAERGAPGEAVRAVRLRRAALLEQRLNRIPDAIRELLAVLATSESHEGALRYLADLYERVGAHAQVVPVLRRLESLSIGDRRTIVDVEVRAARSLLRAGDVAAARAALESALGQAEPTYEASVLRVEIARAGQSPRELGDALDALAAAAVDERSDRADMLVEASQCAARVGDTRTALRRAQLAARVAPDLASAQLFARGLEYKLRGAGTAEEARETLIQLGYIRGSLEPEDVALRAFLHAEAADVVAASRPSDAMPVLLQALDADRPQPLVALGIAERLAREGKAAEALARFDQALSGSLLGLRRASGVAMTAAEVARKAGDFERAHRYLNEAAKDPDLRVHALRSSAAVSAAQGDVDRARRVLEGLAEGLAGEDRAQVLAQLARVLFASGQAELRVEGEQALERAAGAAPPGSLLRAQLLDELARGALGALPARFSDLPAPRRSTPAPPSEGAAVVPSPVVPADLERAVEVATTPALRAQARRAVAHALLAQGARSSAEEVLRAAAEEGSAEACDELGDLLEGDAERITDLIRVRRRAVELAPGDRARLERLLTVVKRDGFGVYARALEHIVRAFDPGAGPIPAPPLSAQREQAGFVNLLLRHSAEASGEAMGILWDAGSALFARRAATFAVAGLERIVPGPMTALSRAYEAAMRLLDVPKLPIYVRRAPGPISFTVTLLTPPAVVFSGDVREDSTALRHAFGVAISAALPQNVLLYGLGHDDARTTYAALLGAFGPEGSARTLDRASAPLAEAFWQTIPPRAQRRLRELLGAAKPAEFALLLERARQSGRRTGMFLSGDFGHAARVLLAEYGEDPRSLEVPGALERRCRDLPSLADLYRLAVRPEYAEARWQPAPPQPTRRPSSSTRIGP